VASASAVAYCRRSCGAPITTAHPSPFGGGEGERTGGGRVVGSGGGRAVAGGVVHRRCAGKLTVIQRFGGGLNLNVHFHTLVLDGVFTQPVPGGPLVFHAAPLPSDAEVGRVVITVRRRVLRLLVRRGYGQDAGAASLSVLCPHFTSRLC
jgi:hypothetical protein